MLPGCPTGRDKSHFSDRVHLKAGLQIATFSYPSSLSSFKPISYNLSLHGSSSATSYQRRNKKTGSRNGNTRCHDHHFTIPLSHHGTTQPLVQWAGPHLSTNYDPFSFLSHDRIAHGRRHVRPFLRSRRCG